MEKTERYHRIYIQLEELLKAVDNPVSQMATIAAVLHHKIDYCFWTGFYLLQNKRLLVGPYQGFLACQELPYGKGVCWHSIQKRKTVIVPDVHLFPGHIACDSRSKSEIVVPVFNKNNIIYGVLDIDSKKLNSFDETDQNWLEKICRLILL